MCSAFIGVAPLYFAQGIASALVIHVDDCLTQLDRQRLPLGQWIIVGRLLTLSPIVSLADALPWFAAHDCSSRCTQFSFRVRRFNNSRTAWVSSSFVMS